MRQYTGPAAVTVSFPRAWASNIAGALVERAVDVIFTTDIIPSYLYQFADLWKPGELSYGGYETFWEAVYWCDKRRRWRVRRVLERNGLPLTK